MEETTTVLIFGVVMIALGLALILWRRRIGGWGLQGRWKDFRLWPTITAKEPDPHWWVYIFLGAVPLLLAPIAIFLWGGLVPCVLGMTGGLLMRLGFDKKRGGPPPDPAATNARVLLGAGICLLVLGMIIVGGFGLSHLV